MKNTDDFLYFFSFYFNLNITYNNDSGTQPRLKNVTFPRDTNLVKKV